MPLSSLKILIPLVFSPDKIAHWTGAAPRHFGSIEKWTLIHPNSGIESNCSGMILPNAIVITSCGESSLIRFNSSESFEGL